MSSNPNICAVCKIPASQICAGCKSVFYCNREHQKKHWKEGHRNNCSSYKVVVSEKIGHHIVASRDIKQNEIILKDMPIVVGPAKTNSVNCLGCNKKLRQKSGEEYRCTGCNWPVCNKKCQESSLHKAECGAMKNKLLKENSDINSLEKNKNMAAIAPLRCLLLKLLSPSNYEIMRSLPPPNASKEQEDQIKTVVIPFIQNTVQLQVEEKDIAEVSKIFEVHSIEITKEEGTVNCRGIYPVATLLKQDCKPNTKHAFQRDNNQLVLIATVPIAKGDIITTSHVELLWGTLTRRAYLLENKNIACTCVRCADNTEFGTYLGAIFCSKCKTPHEESCPKMLSTDPLNQTAIWKCEKCNHTIRGRQMAWGNEAIKSEINRIDKRIPLNLEQFLVKYKETLHAKNYHALVAKYVLTQIYGNHESYLYAGK